MIDYHAHFTVPNNTKIPQKAGFKLTEIILEDETRTQLDTMLTKHFRLGCKCFYTVKDIIDYCFEISNEINAIRFKLEQTSGFNIPISKENYVEIHCKVSEDIILDNTWKRSKNPKNLNITGKYDYFWNKRIYSSDFNINEIITNTHQYLSNIDYEELKFEQIIIDTNHKIDAWWA